MEILAQNENRFHHNTCCSPTTWLMRVLQEDSFSQPNQNAAVDHNLFVYSGAMSDEFANVPLRQHDRSG